MDYPGPAIAGLALVAFDEHFVVVEKPVRLLSVPGRGPDKQDCASARVQAAVPDALVVHRLDMATSGLLLMARGLDAQRSFSRQFERREVLKRYVAVVAGHLQRAGDDWREIDLPLAADWPNRPRQVVDRQRGRASRTRWRVLGYDMARDATRIELEPLTGRAHQLRVHLLALGHPILGDALYAPPAVQELADRLLLHATELRIAHPVTGEPMHWRSPAPF